MFFLVDGHSETAVGPKKAIHDGSCNHWLFWGPAQPVQVVIGLLTRYKCLLFLFNFLKVYIMHSI